jgi:hypothetical protein
MRPRGPYVIDHGDGCRDLVIPYRTGEAPTKPDGGNGGGFLLPPIVEA